MDSNLRIPLTAKLLKLPQSRVACGSDRVATAPANLPVLGLERRADGRLDTHDLLVKLGAMDCNEVLFECGATLAGTLIQSGLLDEIVMYIAPRMMGQDARSLLNIPTIDTMDDLITLNMLDVRRVGQDLRLTIQPISSSVEDDLKPETGKSMSTVIEGDFSASDAKFAIIVARFNGFVVEGLLAGALDTLKRHGIADDNITIVRVPGAFEMPLATQAVAEKGEHDAILTLGAVIRGGTPHFEYVAGECASGIAHLALANSVPIAFGVLTTDTIEQAIERSGTKAGNKGVDAAMTALEMVSLMRRLA